MLTAFGSSVLPEPQSFLCVDGATFIGSRPALFLFTWRYHVILEGFSVGGRGISVPKTHLP